MQRTRHVVSVQLWVRGYAVSVAPSRVYEGKVVPRRYGERKSFLYNQYTRMLGASGQAPMILLQHKEFNARKLQVLRREIELANFQVCTLPYYATRRCTAKIDQSCARPSSELLYATMLVQGGLAVLTLPSLNPPQLNAILRAIDRAVPPKKAIEEDAGNGKKRKDDDADFIPGRPRPRIKPDLTPELKVMGMLPRLPTLDTLRAQIVGLLSSPAMQLAAVLSEASGGKLARTLEGLKKGLEEGHGAETGAPL
ncbi:hypothetical protein EDC04DRAFT_2921151 [Pisolithus marmoratus]|nr:hypothetical protein EDC04DRAFT_2921151 [Pisolithus marmoratus]